MSYFAVVVLLYKWIFIFWFWVTVVVLACLPFWILFRKYVTDPIVFAIVDMQLKRKWAAEAALDAKIKEIVRCRERDTKQDDI